MEEIIIATKNKGKLREFTRMLSPLGYKVISAEEAGFTDEIEETGATGVCDGEILREKRGEGGFGYDPIFGVSCGKSFGELLPEEKDKISHRGRALRELVKLLSEKDK